GDLFDVHATGCRDDEHQASPIAIERDAEVELVIDRERLLAPEGVHRVIANPQREDALRFPARVLGCVHHGDAAGLAAAADRHLPRSSSPLRNTTTGRW